MPVGGIVRAARRPAGWRVPGPRPPAIADPALGPHAGEDLCHLAGDWRILQQIAGHRWSLDDLVTAWAAATIAAAAPPRRFLDLGCGIGTVLMLLAWRFPEARGVGVEAQAASVDLARRSLAWNGAASRCDVRHADFRALAGIAADGGFDVVTGTPPYLTPGRATPSHRAQCGPCRFEERGGVEDYCTAAAGALGPTGSFVTCAAAFQHERVVAGAVAAGLALAHRMVVVPRAGKAPLFAVYAFGPRPGNALPDRLVVRDHSNRWTAEFRTVRAAMGMPCEVD